MINMSATIRWRYFDAKFFVSADRYLQTMRNIRADLRHIRSPSVLLPGLLTRLKNHILGSTFQESPKLPCRPPHIWYIFLPVSIL